MSWIVLTRGTGMVKLAWINKVLTREGITSRLNGASFQAPVLEVLDRDLDRACVVLGPVDRISDDDPMFECNKGSGWWVGSPVWVGVLASAIGVVANRVRRALASRVRCSPSGDSEIDCPMATGKIAECPGGLWSLCRPMARLEVHLIAIGTVLGAQDHAVISKSAELIHALDSYCGEVENRTCSVAFCHVLGVQMSEGGLGWLTQERCRLIKQVVSVVMSETERVSGMVLPKRSEVVGVDVLARLSEEWSQN